MYKWVTLPSALWLIVQTVLPNPLSVTSSQCSPFTSYHGSRAGPGLCPSYLSPSFTVPHLSPGSLSYRQLPSSCHRLLISMWSTWWRQGYFLHPSGGMGLPSYPHPPSLPPLPQAYSIHHTGFPDADGGRVNYILGPGQTSVNKPKERADTLPFSNLFKYSYR